ncbi:hypothetical protein Plhal304r1_c016g0058101 [Plasmopara halstedii]
MSLTAYKPPSVKQTSNRNRHDLHEAIHIRPTQKRINYCLSISAGGRDSSCASKTDIIPVLHLFHDTRYSAAQLETSPEVSNQISGLLQGLAGCELLKFVSLLEIELLTSLWFL